MSENLDLVDKIIEMKWKPIIIDGENTGYEINDRGMVRNTKFMKILSPIKLSSGILQVNLSFNGKVVSKSIHNLVAKAFLPNPKWRKKVHHINQNRSDNRVENLEWAGPLKGIHRDFPNRVELCGEYSPRSVYSVSQVHRICELLQQGKLNDCQIARITGVTHQTVNNIRNRKSWRSISENYYF